MTDCFRAIGFAETVPSRVDCVRGRRSAPAEPPAKSGSAIRNKTEKAKEKKSKPANTGADVELRVVRAARMSVERG